jgi:hypothetical protein
LRAAQRRGVRRVLAPEYAYEKRCEKNLLRMQNNAGHSEIKLSAYYIACALDPAPISS